MSNPCDLNIILPAYLEAENLNILLPQLNETLSALSYSYEIIVVDTQVPLDNTEQVCLKHKATYTNRKNGDTFGDAVRSGIALSRGRWVIFMDADGSHQPGFVKNLLEYKDSYNIVIASRYVSGGLTENPASLIMMSKILNKIYARVLRIPCKDISNSFKLYDGDQLRSINLTYNNFDIVEEILVKLMRQYPAITIKEVPFVFRKRMFGQTKRNLILFIATYVISLARLKMQRKSRKN